MVAVSFKSSVMKFVLYSEFPINIANSHFTNSGMSNSLVYRVVWQDFHTTVFLVNFYNIIIVCLQIKFLSKCNSDLFHGCCGSPFIQNGIVNHVISNRAYSISIMHSERVASRCNLLQRPHLQNMRIVDKYIQLAGAW